MNKELVQNLAKMAHSDALAEYRLRMKTEFAGDVIFADIYDLKFSELIVLECVQRIDYWESRQGEHCGDLLEHFGVGR
jgi:hypothetical protein